MSVTERLFGVREAAAELDMDGVNVLLLIRSGELDAGKGKDGHVYVPEPALRDYQRRQTEKARENR
jgi:hypothetical protein